MSRFGKLLREPLVHFLLAAVLILTAQTLWRSLSKPVIGIEGDAFDRMLRELRNDPTQPDREIDPVELARAMIVDEILFREARARGVENSPVVRELLIQEFRRVLEPPVPEPDRETLEAYRARFPDLYQFPPRIAFEHASFRTGTTFDDGAVLASLRGGASPREVGTESVRLANPLPPTFKPQLDRILGLEASDAIFEMKPGVWAGPITSERGVHFIRVTRIEPPAAIPIEQVERTLSLRWQQEMRERAVREQLVRLARKYRFRVPPELEEAIPR